MHSETNIPTPADWWRYDPYSNNGKPQLIAHYADTGGMRATEYRVGTRRRKPNGWLFPTEYYLTYGSTRNKVGNITFSPQGYTFGPNGGFWYTYNESITGFVQVPYPPSSLPELGNMLSRAETKALLALKDQKVNLGVALAEYRQTASFVGKTFDALGRSISNAKKGNWPRAIRDLKRAYRDSTRTIALRNGRQRNNRIIDKYLEWQYAASPLIQDVNGSIAALRDRTDTTEWVQTVKGVVVERDTVRTALDTEDLNLYSADCVTELFAGVFVRLDYLPDNTFLTALSRAGASNPFSVLWEKTPWSFVVDWAFKVGDWLSALDATLGYKFLSGSYTMRQSRIDRVSASNRPLKWEKFYARPVRLGSRQFGGVRRSFRLHRRPYSSTPWPALVVKNPVSLTHVANGLALLTSVVTGKSPSNSTLRK